jgi:hypothetical protein
MLPPWLFALIVLFAVCAIGWYVIYSRHAGVPEGFANATPTAAAVAPVAAPAAPATAPAPTAAAPIPSRPTLTSSLQQTAAQNPNMSISDYLALAKEAGVNQYNTITPQLQGVVSQIQSNIPTSLTPSLGQLFAAQDASGSVVPGALTSEPSIYKAFQQYLKPHETPAAAQPALTANQKGADAVLANAILTPSIRQMIRDDVREAVADELAAQEPENEYEITYDQE